MKTIIVTLALIVVTFVSSFAQNDDSNYNQVVFTRTFSVEYAKNFNFPTSQIEVVRDETLKKGTVRVEVILDTNAPNDVLADLKQRNRYSFFENSQEIGFAVSQRMVSWGRGVELEEKFKVCVYMSRATSKM